MTEAQLHKQICQYLKLKGVIFNTDMSGIKLSIGQAKKMKSLRSSRAFPDIAIYERNSKGEGALFLEVKKDNPFKRDGTLKSGEHLQEQSDMLDNLRLRGYVAQFVWTFEQAQWIIDTYLDR